MHFLKLFCLFFSLVVIGCNSTQPIKNVENETECLSSKVKFNFYDLNQRGLTQESNFTKGVEYEFCIEKDSSLLSQIMRIDAGLKVSESAGKIGCDKNQWLILGTTYNKDYVNILCKLTKLNYVKEIHPTYWE